MTEETASNTLLQDESDGTINGISIASFLQMLEQEKHNGRIQVQSEGKSGILYFEDGELIDAEYGQLFGIEAAYTIVSWENSSIALIEAIPRTKQIEEPLGYILLNAAKQQDEQTEKMSNPTITYVSSEAENNSDYQNTVEVLSNIPGIRYFYLLNRAGKIVVHSAPNPNLGELIIYCIITSSNLRKTLKVKSPRRIHMQLQDGSSLLIMPKAGKILGMMLDVHSSAEEVASRINSSLSVK